MHGDVAANKTEADASGTGASEASTLRAFQAKLPYISRLEQLSAAASMRELDTKNAIAMLCGKHMRFFVTSSTIDIGRSTNTLGKV